MSETERCYGKCLGATLIAMYPAPPEVWGFHLCNQNLDYSVYNIALHLLGRDVVLSEEKEGKANYNQDAFTVICRNGRD